MEKQKNTNIESFIKTVIQLSPISLQLMQSNAEVLLARDRMEQQKKELVQQQEVREIELPREPRFYPSENSFSNIVGKKQRKKMKVKISKKQTASDKKQPVSKEELAFIIAAKRIKNKFKSECLDQLIPYVILHDKFVKV